MFGRISKATGNMKWRNACLLVTPQSSDVVAKVPFSFGPWDIRSDRIRLGVVFHRFVCVFSARVDQLTCQRTRVGSSYPWIQVILEVCCYMEIPHIDISA